LAGCWSQHQKLCCTLRTDKLNSLIGDCGVLITFEMPPYEVSGWLAYLSISLPISRFVPSTTKHKHGSTSQTDCQQVKIEGFHRSANAADKRERSAIAAAIDEDEMLINSCIFSR
jgi:hypothetical protein